MRLTVRILIFAAALMLSACTTQYVSDDLSSADAGYGPSSAEKQPELVEYKWPKNYYGSLGEGGDGCLELSVPRGDEAYYVKLKQGDEDVWDAFLHPGGQYRFGVPTGTFDLVYAAGESWYGWDDSFGPQGAYSRSDKRFNFQRNECWAVELIMQPGGNLGRDALDYEAF